MRMMYVPQIGQRLKQLRSERDLTQAQLGNLLGLSKSVISSYENNVHYPPYDILLRLANIFGVSTDYLLGAEPEQTINVEGLTTTQIKAVSSFVNELKLMNKEK